MIKNNIDEKSCLDSVQNNENTNSLKMIIESQKETIESQKTTINCCKIAIEMLFDKNNPDKLNFDREIKQTYIEKFLKDVNENLSNK